MKSFVKFLVVVTTIVVAHLAQAYGMGDADATVDGISYHLVWNNDEGDGVVLTLPAAAEKGFYILKTK